MGVIKVEAPRILFLREDGEYCAGSPDNSIVVATIAIYTAYTARSIVRFGLICRPDSIEWKIFSVRARARAREYVRIDCPGRDKPSDEKLRTLFRCYRASATRLACRPADYARFVKMRKCIRPFPFVFRPVKIKVVGGTTGLTASIEIAHGYVLYPNTLSTYEKYISASKSVNARERERTDLPLCSRRIMGRVLYFRVQVPSFLPPGFAECVSQFLITIGRTILPSMRKRRGSYFSFQLIN